MSNITFSSMQDDTLRQYRFLQAPGKLSTNIDGEAVIMDVQAGTYSSLNSVGSFIWNQLQDENDFFSILKTMLDYFDIDSNTATQELAVFLELLTSKELITATLKK